MKYVSADEAVKLVKSGDWVFFQGSTAVPVIIQEALARRADELRGVNIVSGFNITKGPAPFCRPEYKESFFVNSLFLCADQREYVAQGYGSLIPGFLGELPSLIRRHEIPVDVACINCSLPDENGYCSYNISADLAQPAVESAKIVIAQVNKSIPYLYGTAMIHESQITAAVECDDPPVDMQFGPPTEIESAIGSYIAAEIPDGATLQIGVGGIPNATLNGLKDHKHLGLHTEAMTDGVFRLMQSGVIDNSLKKIEPGEGYECLASFGHGRLRQIRGNVVAAPATCMSTWTITRMPSSMMSAGPMTRNGSVRTLTPWPSIRPSRLTLPVRSAPTA